MARGESEGNVGFIIQKSKMNKIRTILVACCLLPVFCSCGEVAKRMDAKLAESKAAIGIVENTTADGVGESSLSSGSKKSSATAAATAEYKDLEIPARTVIQAMCPNCLTEQRMYSPPTVFKITSSTSPIIIPPFF